MMGFKCGCIDIRIGVLGFHLCHAGGRGRVEGQVKRNGGAS